MNPKPFSSENHFTVPVAMCLYLHGVCAANAEELLRQLAGATRFTSRANSRDQRTVAAVSAHDVALGTALYNRVVADERDPARSPHRHGLEVDRHRHLR